jgi:hypothetical protein
MVVGITPALESLEFDTRPATGLAEGGASATSLVPFAPGRPCASSQWTMSFDQGGIARPPAIDPTSSSTRSQAGHLPLEPMQKGRK